MPCVSFPLRPLAWLLGLLVAPFAHAGEPVSFLDDILPILSKAGCNGSGCHSKPQGQNGFQLSVFAYDPEADYREITQERHGRRLARSAPETSLLLLKATQRVPHEGGKRFEPDSEAYQTIVDWIGNGLLYRHEDDAEVVRVEVTPADRAYAQGASLALHVTAHDAKGRERDVTRFAAFESHKESLVEVTDDGLLKVGNFTGEGVITARYLGHVATATVTVPATDRLPEERYDTLPVKNFIDELAYAKLRKLGLYPSERSDDATFLRRVSLDLIGELPTAARVRAFLADDDPDKRANAVEALLDDPHYAEHWGTKWADLFRPNPDRVGVKSVYLIDQWLRRQFRENTPYDIFAREILTAQGSTHRHGPTVIYRDRRLPEDRTTLFSQIFLGVRLECAKCHHHPNEKWSQKDFYQLAAYFGELKQKGTGISPPISGGYEVFYHAPGSGHVKHPVTGEVLAPKAPEAESQSLPEGSDPRVALADWLVDPENPFFARAAVNRVWAELMGRGLVHPVDDFRTTNPAANEPLLEALAHDFAANGYDMKQLLRRITSSHLYQLSSEPSAWNLSDTEQFSRSYRRRLPAEVVADALVGITGVPDDYNGLPPAGEAKRIWTFKTPSFLLDAFGQPDSSSDCPCERNMSTSVTQALNLMHSEALQSKLSDEKGFIRELAESDRSPESIVEEIYLTVYGRFPTPDEAAVATDAFSAPEATRQTACEDIAWALINSAEFVFNH